MRDTDGLPETTLILLDAFPDGATLLDERGVIRHANPAFASLVARTPDDVVGRPFANVVPGAAMANAATRAPARVRVGDRDLPVEVTSTPVALGEGPAHLVVVRALPEPSSRESGVLPVAAPRADAATELALSEQRFRLAFEHNMAPMVFSDHDGLFLAVNDAYCKMTGRAREELLGRDSKHFTYPEDIGITEGVYRRIISGEIDEANYAKRFLHKSGRIVWTEVAMCAARDESGEILYFISSVRDVTEERALAAQLSHQALHDPLTGLANRALFDVQLARAHAQLGRASSLNAVVLIDLDNFKGVNDAYGHLIGDELLVAIARRFEAISRSSDTLCRFGGDEFLYLAEGLASADEVQIVAQRFLDALSEPFAIQNVRIEQRASVGVVVWSGDDADGEDLVQNADTAMYKAKSLGTGRVVVFTPEIRHEAVSRFTLAQDLRGALASGQLSMHFQKIVDLESDRVVGYESLMRWHHPEHGYVPPDVFIPLAEHSDLIVELGRFALHEAVVAASAWVAEPGQRAPYVTVNLSSPQFHDPDLIPTIERELASAGVDPERLVLEVTEAVALVDLTGTMTAIERLRHLGVGVALDNFGTGYSSLSYLAALNPRIVKIDESFVRPKRDLDRSTTLLEAIITLGNKLGMTVLAEGIETTEQLERLHHLSCDLGQGFLWSPAVPLAETTHLLLRGHEE